MKIASSYRESTFSADSLSRSVHALLIRITSVYILVYVMELTKTNCEP